MPCYIEMNLVVYLSVLHVLLLGITLEETGGVIIGFMLSPYNSDTWHQVSGRMAALWGSASVPTYLSLCVRVDLNEPRSSNQDVLFFTDRLLQNHCSTIHTY